MQISVVPAESSAGGKKRSIKIHGCRRWIAELSRVSATTAFLPTAFFGELCSPDRRAGNSRHRMDRGTSSRPFLVYSPWATKFYPSSPRARVRTRLEMPFLSMYAFLLCHRRGEAQLGAAGEMHLFMFRRFSFIVLQGTLSRGP